MPERYAICERGYRRRGKHPNHAAGPQGKQCRRSSPGSSGHGLCSAVWQHHPQCRQRGVHWTDWDPTIWYQNTTGTQRAYPPLRRCPITRLRRPRPGRYFDQGRDRCVCLSQCGNHSPGGNVYRFKRHRICEQCYARDPWHGLSCSRRRSSRSDPASLWRLR